MKLNEIEAAYSIEAGKLEAFEDHRKLCEKGTREGQESWCEEF